MEENKLNRISVVMAIEHGVAHADNQSYLLRIVFNSCITNNFAHEIPLGKGINEGENPVCHDAMFCARCASKSRIPWHWSANLVVKFILSLILV